MNDTNLRNQLWNRKEDSVDSQNRFLSFYEASNNIDELVFSRLYWRGGHPVAALPWHFICSGYVVLALLNVAGRWGEDLLIIHGGDVWEDRKGCFGRRRTVPRRFGWSMNLLWDTRLIARLCISGAFKSQWIILLVIWTEIVRGIDVLVGDGRLLWGLGG